MTNISKQILLICAFASVSFTPAGADPFNMPANGGMDPSLTPAARARVNARDAQISKGMGKLEGVPRSNGRVFGQIDFANNGDILLGGFDARVNGTASTSPPRNHDPGKLQRLGVGSGGTGGRIGLDGVPKVNTGGAHVHNTGAGGRISAASVPKVAPNVSHAPSAPHIHTPR
jgi:hypothetical protein